MREQIVKEAMKGEHITPEWVAMQTVKLYRQNVLQGMSHEEALHMAKQEMKEISGEVISRRKMNAREIWREHIAPWLVIIIGILACIGWWNLWA